MLNQHKNGFLSSDGQGDSKDGNAQASRLKVEETKTPRRTPQKPLLNILLGKLLLTPIRIIKWLGRRVAIQLLTMIYH
jgi:hypothetical protein